MGQINMTLRISDSTYNTLQVMSEDIGISKAACLRMILKNSLDKYNSDKAEKIRENILSPETSGPTELPQVVDNNPTKKDWDALSFDARKPIVQAYRNKMRGNAYDDNLEPYFIFVADAQK